MILTDNQKAWDATKAAARDARRRPPSCNPLIVRQTGSWYRNLLRAREVPIGPQGTRPRRVTQKCADCPHGWKHHTEAGRCRRGCACTNGADR